MSNSNSPLETYFDETGGLSAKTRANRESVLKSLSDFLDDRGVSLLDAETTDIRDYIKHRHGNDGLAGSTLNQYRRDISAFYSEWMEGGVCPTVRETNPARFDVEKAVSVNTTPKKQRFTQRHDGAIHLSRKEVRELCEHVATPAPRNVLIIKLLVRTGLRRGELVELRQSDVRDDRVVVRQEAGKTDDYREVPYDNIPEMRFYENYRDGLRTSDSQYYFVSKQGKGKKDHISEATVSRVIRDAAEKAGIQERYAVDANGNDRRRITAHTLRATFISRLFDNDVPIPKIMQLTGHDQTETLDQYVSSRTSEAVEAYRNADVSWEA